MQKINTLSLQPIGSSVAVRPGLFFCLLILWLQADALIVPDGLNPWQADLQAIENLCLIKERTVKMDFATQYYGWTRSVIIIFFSNWASGLLLSLASFLFWIYLYLSYLSLIVVGEPFLSFHGMFC